MTTKATKLDRDHYGLTVYQVDNMEYAVGSDKQATKAAHAEIMDSLWAFNSSFIASFCGFDDRAVASLRKMQEDLCEDCNDLVRAMISAPRGVERTAAARLRAFCERAINADGRGHFLSPYDGEEYDSDDIPGLPKGKFAYRID